MPNVKHKIKRQSDQSSTPEKDESCTIENPLEQFSRQMRRGSGSFSKMTKKKPPKQSLRTERNVQQVTEGVVSMNLIV